MRRAAFLFLTLGFAAAGFFLGYYLFVQQDVFDLNLATTTGYGMAALTTLIALAVGIVTAPRIIALTIALNTRSVEHLQRMPIQDLIIAALGLIVGLLIANLIGSILKGLGWFGTAIGILVSVFLGYLGLMVGIRKREELVGLLANLPWLGKDRGTRGEAKLLDTSAIIDGRIADLCSTGFLEGTLIIPAFVLDELQHIADSSDTLKRNRGRRGLDILNYIRRKSETKVQIYENVKGLEDLPDVDTKLVKLARRLGARIITNDFNLNKVAELQGVKVLNINELANALKPVLLPGEEMTVQVIRDGKEPGQGVGYLDDGTMIVVDGGKRFIGQTIRVTVTSVLQTTAGRMIFARPKVGRKDEPLHGKLDEVNAVGG
ncbi:MAG: PIN/TRAM domain-containing protein [Thermoanaerobacterales bacterium]|nr:PIN/TRAM domain-containing protein [Bacillota bacterium]MDI6907549.1 PIN/TRAM domain-containing protein [Thermoanaerobacterales bacterium]